MLTDPGSLLSDLTRTKERLCSTERALETMRVALEKNVDWLRQVDDYKRQREEAKAATAELETKVALMLKKAEIAEEKSSRFEGELITAESSSREVKIKYEAFLRLRDRDLRISSHAARKDVKSIGASVVNQMRDHLSLMKGRSLVEHEIDEIKANQDFLVGIQRGDYPDLEAEAASMAEDLLVVKGKLAAMPLPSLDLDELARRFDESSPPPDEVGSETAQVLVETQATDDPAPLAAIPLMSAPFDQFGSMTVSLTVEDALSLRESDPPEESRPRVEESAEGVKRSHRSRERRRNRGPT
ncbi:unnamed protein product [Cochlearia groenlandica]